MPKFEIFNLPVTDALNLLNNFLPWWLKIFIFTTWNFLNENRFENSIKKFFLLLESLSDTKCEIITFFFIMVSFRSCSFDVTPKFTLEFFMKFRRSKKVPSLIKNENKGRNFLNTWGHLAKFLKNLRALNRNLRKWLNRLICQL